MNVKAEEIHRLQINDEWFMSSYMSEFIIDSYSEEHLFHWFTLIIVV